MRRESRKNLYQKTEEAFSRQSKRFGWLPTTRPTFAQKYVLTFLFVASAVLVRWLLERSFGDRYPYILFGPPVLLAALLGGIGPGLVATALCAFAAAMFPGPHGSFSDALATALFCAYGILITLYVEQFRRARAEEIRRAGEEHLRSLYESSLDGILLTRPETGEIITANPAALSMFGMTIEEIRKAGRAGIVAEDGVVMKKFEERSKHDRWRGELTLRRKDGSTFPAELSSSFFTGPDGTMSSMSIRDITERKEAERRLRESEAMLAYAQQMAHVGHWDRDLSTGRVYWSDETYRIFGLDPQSCEVHGSFLFQHVHPDDRERVERAIRDAAEGVKRYEEIYRPVRPDGSIRWAHARGEVFRTPEGKALRMFGTILDITDRRQMEEELRRARDGLELRVEERTHELSSAYRALQRSEEKYRDLYDQATDVIFTTDLEGRITSANAKAMELFSRARTVAGIPFLKEILTVDGYDRAVALLSRAVAENSDLSDEQPWEFEARTNDGATVTLEVKARLMRKDGTITGFQGIARDITHRKRLEEDRAKLSCAVERAGEGIFMVGLDRRFTYVNAAFCNMFGYATEEIVGQTTAITRNDRPGEPSSESLWERLESGETWSGRQTRKRKDGTLAEMESTIAPIRDASGAVTHYLGVIRDIGQQLRLEEQLRQSQKMEAVGTLAGGIAHDFNNILTVMMGYGTLLQAGLGEDNPMREYVDQLLSSTEKAAQLTHGLLAFSRKQPVTLKPVSLNSVVRNTKKLLKRLLREDIEFRVRLGHDDITIVGDASQVDQILFNLASNARDAMPNGGILTIETKRIDLDGAFQDVHGYGKPGAYALISITDTGVGMDRATKEHIFDPFFTTKEAGVGTGLGLSTIYGIVRQHGGYINVYSEPQMGTTFHIYLPLADRAGEEEDQVSMAAGGGDETILIAEDDDAVRGLIKSILVAHGYRIVEAVDGADAVEQLRKSKDVALAIFDSVMPRKNGREACAEALRIRPDLKIIFMSGYTRDVFFEEGIDGAKPDFIQKPISPSVLLAKVREVLDTRKPG